MTRLAVMCQHVADDGSMSPEIAAQATSLKREWALLVASQTPPPSSLEEHERIQQQKAELKKRMVEFLEML